MTKGSGFKKKVRARMAETGESYTQARRALEGTKPKPEPAPEVYYRRQPTEPDGRPWQEKDR
jgi:hypothetical protein